MKDSQPKREGTPPEGIVQAIIAMIWGRPWTPVVIAASATAVVAFAIWQSLPDATKTRLLERDQHAESGDPLADINTKLSMAESRYDALDGVETHKRNLEAIPEKYPLGFDLPVNPFGDTMKQNIAVISDCVALLKQLESYDLTENESRDAAAAHSWAAGLTADPNEVYRFTNQVADSLIGRRAAAKRELESLRKQKERIINAL